MCQKMKILLITTTLILTVHSDNVLKCYMCTSLSDKGCNSSVTATSLKPMECNGESIANWQRIIQQHNELKPLARIFGADVSRDYSTRGDDLACAKAILNVKGQEKPLFVRTCQTAKTENIDPCKTMEQKLKEDFLGKMEQCSLCLEDGCNGSVTLSPEIFCILVTLLGTLAHVALYP